MQGKIEENQPQMTDLPTQDQFEEMEQFAENIRRKVASEDWESSPESKRRLLQMLHVKVFIAKDGTARVTGWFGETPDFSSALRSRSARPVPRCG